jgi:hypothetical protein
MIQIPKRNFEIKPLRIGKRRIPTVIEMKLKEFNENNEISLEVDSNRSIQYSELHYQHSIQDLETPFPVSKRM